MMYFNRFSRIATGLCILIVYLLSGLVIVSAAAADAYYDGYFGDPIDLHGVSYTGTQVFLFMTGPNLPANGATLTAISLRADQGHFTTVDLNSNQEWSFTWNTARLQSLTDPGTYTIYITTEAVDLSHLGGTHVQNPQRISPGCGDPSGIERTRNLHINTVRPYPRYRR